MPMDIEFFQAVCSMYAQIIPFTLAEPLAAVLLLLLLLSAG